MPADWPRRRELTKQLADGLCQAEIHEPDCDGIGTECDHVKQGDDHSLANLQWLSLQCHKAKTQADKPQRRRPAEIHPGLIT